VRPTKYHILKPWEPWGQLTPTRTVGQLGFNKNGTAVDIWIRIDGKSTWFAVDGAELKQFLNSEHESVILEARSDGNAE
jgi:hypothetical protein